ncbi:hypothetical protein Desmer_3108 [Desulfosporosinus meridiei DSM 13257]|uniref:Uncharacterized protein n=1 Tax=Desulfosporosinus meridiei (strain ATCC BAA-275 / DSM 13257 / KCTC 12902 / NCIMB 13706 / S10) TaxID=768704 RepID=J7ITF8_DESMD|nr:hypothetical protein Desmer_3108 [Desulfosporosinus meridiei DSM 13257]
MIKYPDRKKGLKRFSVSDPSCGSILEGFLICFLKTPFVIRDKGLEN